RHPDDIRSLIAELERSGPEEVVEYLREVSLPHAERRFGTIERLQARGRRVESHGTMASEECGGLVGDRRSAPRAAALKVRARAPIAGAAPAEPAPAPHLRAVRPGHRPSARNLVAPVWLRCRAIRAPQAELADLGLSSLARLESRVMPTLEA